MNGPGRWFCCYIIVCFCGCVSVYSISDHFRALQTKRMCTATNINWASWNMRLAEIEDRHMMSITFREKHMIHTIEVYYPSWPSTEKIIWRMQTSVEGVWLPVLRRRYRQKRFIYKYWRKWRLYTIRRRYGMRKSLHRNAL